MTIFYLDDKRISHLLDYPAVVDTLQLAFNDLAFSRAHIHKRQRTEAGSVRFNSMGAVWGAKNVAGIKVYPTVSGQFSFLINLFDLECNQPLAVLDGGELTKFRTAGMTALLAKHGARKDSKKMALIGAGYQGRAQFEALSHFFALTDLAVVDPAADEEWCKKIECQMKINVRIEDSEAAVRDADIVVTATRSPSPVFDGNWLKRGAFVSAIGTSTPKVRELDDVTLSRASRIIVEWAPQSLLEAGELVLWSPSHEQDRSKIIDVPTLLASSAPWRRSDQDIIVAKSVGVGLADVACAYLAYRSSALAAPDGAVGVGI